MTFQQIMKLAATDDVAQMNVNISNAADFGLVGDWAPSTDYVIGDKVVDATNSPLVQYRANTDHTSSATFLDDIANWTIIGSGGGSGGLTFKGLWNADTNTPSLASGTGDQGDLYIVSVAGTTNLDGISDWQVNDHAIFNGTTWEKIDNTDQITWLPVTFTDDHIIKNLESGLTLVMDISVSKMFTLPPATTANVGLIYRIVVGDAAGDVIVEVDDDVNDVIDEHGLGEGIRNIGGSTGDHVLLLLIKENLWIILSEKGTWIETTPPPIILNNGFIMAGHNGSNFISTLQKFPFATTTDAISHGNLTATLSSNAGAHDTVLGFGITMGGSIPANSAIINKFPFSTDTGGVSHGSMLEIIGNAAGCSSQSTSEAFAIGGASSGTERSSISRIPFATDSGAVAHGNIGVVRTGSVGVSANTLGRGIVAGGSDGGVEKDIIDYFLFASITTSVSHGVLSATKRNGSPSESQLLVRGYHNAGFDAANTNIIDRFDFASNTTAGGHGDLLTALSFLAGHSSNTQGFVSAGGGDTNQIQKYNFSSNVTAVDHADVLQASLTDNTGTQG